MYSATLPAPARTASTPIFRSLLTGRLALTMLAILSFLPGPGSPYRAIPRALHEYHPDSSTAAARLSRAGLALSAIGRRARLSLRTDGGQDFLSGQSTQRTLRRHAFM